jgi:hypothetical protein
MGSIFKNDKTPSSSAINTELMDEHWANFRTECCLGTLVDLPDKRLGKIPLLVVNEYVKRSKCTVQQALKEIQDDISDRRF